MKALKSLAVASSVAIATGVLVAGFVAPAHSADASSAPPGRVPTVTRLVKVFLDREETLSAAMRAGDMASLERTLTEDFELRAGAKAASPIPRADFLSDVARNRPTSGAASQMAVHDLGSIAIVSFVQGDDAKRAVFVVDVWRQSGTDWKLAIRYAGPVGAPDFPIPGAGAPPSEIPKKY
ncbi:MAG TPA: DUF4440 domain-containing protein [Casimicrobiaceae bacterium]|nr:DUF4440 domain-containing protein [Casimicrobiaceae bacterium]